VPRLVHAVTSRDKRSFLFPLVVGLGMWIGFPTVAAYQDMASLISGSESQGKRWNGFIERSVAGSVHAAEMPFTDSNITGSISGAGISAKGIGQVSFRGKGVTTDIPDENRITRSEKKGRILQVAPVSPPKPFGAGSTIKHSSLLLQPVSKRDVKEAFAKTGILGKEVQIASAFYMKKERKLPGVPANLAPLVNNPTPDILATAYAPAEPDYAKASPFQSLLKDESANAGRFIPPVADGDHSWMSQPLPAGVFSKAEQTCLANAIYFEARSESLRGQAAVAQVVLNRVRNPTYPSTICGVVYQNSNWKNRCQFSFACDGIKDRVTEPRHYKTAQDIAMAVTAGKIFLPEVASSTHYYASYVNPRWAKSMEKMKKIGLHIFYRTYGGGWS
jgi:spore germination cell wall hydrolase CwlJ-like protein